jgi:hypothetical protein
MLPPPVSSIVPTATRSVPFVDERRLYVAEDARRTYAGQLLEQAVVQNAAAGDGTAIVGENAGVRQNCKHRAGVDDQAVAVRLRRSKCKRTVRRHGAGVDKRRARAHERGRRQIGRPVDGDRARPDNSRIPEIVAAGEGDLVATQHEAAKVGNEGAGIVLIAADLNNARRAHGDGADVDDAA